MTQPPSSSPQVAEAPKHMFVVSLSLDFEMCVMAADGHEAASVARQNAEAEADAIDHDYIINVGAPVTDIQCVPREWRDAYPYGVDSTATVEMLLNGEPAK